MILVSLGGKAALPSAATGLSAACDCGISSSYSLTIILYLINVNVMFSVI